MELFAGAKVMPAAQYETERVCHIMKDLFAGWLG